MEKDESSRRKIVDVYMSIFRYFGIIASIIAWIVIEICIILNPWFVFTRDAFSDLGGSGAYMPWIYNYGLIITGIFILFYSTYLILNSRNKLETVGSSFLFIAGLFLILIGVFPSGTRPHTFVSLWFFIQADLSILTWGIGLIIRRRIRLGGFIVLMGLLGSAIGFLVNWPSAATAEAFGIVIIDLWVVLMFKT